MVEDDWWKVKNLKRHEEKVLEINNLDDMETDTGDFGSYRKVLKGASIQSTMLSYHNDLNPRNKIRFINKFTSLKPDGTFAILDAGCGVGFTSHELSRFYKNSKVTGIDISSDGIKYASENFKNVKFICEGIEPTNAPLGCFDLIFCFEFYPFTRTNSFQTHKDYVSYFLSQLKKHGKLVIHQRWGNDDSLSKNIEEIQKAFNQYRFEIHLIPHAKIISFLGNNYLSLVVDKILRLILRKDSMKAIIISEKS